MSVSSSPQPCSLKSLYRLFLRTSSASVLHQKQAKRHLLSIWRPVFSDAAQVTKSLQANNLSPSERQSLLNWLRNWDEQMDHTLSFLYVSATSRGLPHELTRNFSQLYYSECDRLLSQKLPSWNAKLSPDSRSYHPEKRTHVDVNKKEEILRQAQYLEDCAWNPLSLVVGLAEGREKLNLGKMIVKRKGDSRRR